MSGKKPMRSSATVNVKGLDEFRKQLRKLEDAGATEQLKEANYKVASFVISRARTAAAGVGHMQSRAAATMTAGRAQSRATITGGGKVPYFYGAEFGAKSNVLRRSRRAAGWAGPGRWMGYNQFLPWRGSKGNVGYFLFPTMRTESAAIVEMYGDELDRITKDAFPD
jgi:hypothetical protein